MQDLKPKKLICLDNPNNQPEQINAHQAQPNQPKNLQAPNTGTQNIANIFAFIIVAAVILGIATFIISKMSKKAKKITLSIFMLATIAFSGFNGFSKTHAETLIDGKPCQTTGWSEYEVGVRVKFNVAYAEFLQSGTHYETTIKFKGTGTAEGDREKAIEEVDKLSQDKNSLKKFVENTLATFNPNDIPDYWLTSLESDRPTGAERVGNNINFIDPHHIFNNNGKSSWTYFNGDEVIDNGLAFGEYEYDDEGNAEIVQKFSISPKPEDENQIYEAEIKYDAPVYLLRP